jgi:hypothetical protein
MQLNNHSKFYYGWRITSENRFIDFDDGSGVKVAELKVGRYTSSQFAAEVANKMNAQSLVDFTVSFDRNTRKFSISAATTFSLLAATGVNSGSALTVLGYNVDKTGLTTYEADLSSGFSYSTQFFIQSFKDTSTNRKSIGGVINTSASGQIEVIKFGNDRFMEAEFNFITNTIQQSGSIIRSNETGLDEFIQLMEWLTEKAPVEFMIDENNSDSFQTFILESTAADSKGLDYDLIEIYDRGLPDYFRSGLLKFKLI